MGYMNSTTDGASFTQLCTNEALDFLSQFGAFRKDNRGMRQVSTLFQNSFRSCIPILDQVTSFRFQSNAGQISFCMDNISLLPSTLQPAGELTALTTFINTNRWYDNYTMILLEDNGISITSVFQLTNDICNSHSTQKPHLYWTPYLC